MKAFKALWSWSFTGYWDTIVLIMMRKCSCDTGTTDPLL